MEKQLLSIIEGAKNGDESAFSALLEMYTALVDGAVRRFRPSFAEDGESGGLYSPEDLRQYAVIALYKAAITYDADGDGKKVSFGLYAKICINNSLISAHRKYKSEMKRKKSAYEKERLRDTASRIDPLVRLTEAESAAQFRVKVKRVLSKYEREIFDCYISGKSVREIAETLGREEKSVSNAIYRMKVKLKGL